MIVLFIEPALRQCLEWMNQSIRLQKSDEKTFQLPDMYRFISVFLIYRCTNYSFEKTIQMLNIIGHSGLRLKVVRFIISNILGYSPVGRGNCALETWNALKDETQQLSDFERIEFDVVRNVFFGTAQIFAILDDDILGTSATNNQVKSLYNRKADREGHTGDVIADSIFRFVIGLSFRRRRENLQNSIEKLIAAITEGQGENSFNNFIVTADRGYGTESLIVRFFNIGSSSMAVLPDQLFRCHLFAAQSYFNVSREDEVVLFQERKSKVVSVSSDDNQLAASNRDPAVHNDVTNDQSAQRVQEENYVHEAFDRKRVLVIDDDPRAAPKVFHAVKKRRGAKDINTIAVREHGTEKFSSILRFFFVLPEPLLKLVNYWIAVPTPSQYTNHLFGKRGYLVARMKDKRHLRIRTIL